MTVSSYLKQIVDNAIIRDDEKESIDRSIEYLQKCLQSHFGTEVNSHFRFGSHTRGTILPRSMDVNSDIDYMVVFADNSYKPQTYLNKLKQFVEKYYQASQIHQSNPTIVLELNHIKFELVPAIIQHGLFYQQLYIPAKVSDLNDWIATDPNAFNNSLTEKNKEHNFLIKPVIRLVKYWNAINNYPFESYDLERWIVNYDFYACDWLFHIPESKKYFLNFMDDLNLSYFAPDWKKHKLETAKTIIQKVRYYEAQAITIMAETEIRKLIPDPNQRLYGRRALLGEKLSQIRPLL
ncbi:MAG: hypothetical protein ACD_20C00357G0031 [uncultured bacterium]|nr:MAG: hypothetical protein ACD_20C00357G0031 [uncultured bacterium]